LFPYALGIEREKRESLQISIALMQLARPAMAEAARILKCGGNPDSSGDTALDFVKQNETKAPSRFALPAHSKSLSTN
jgi:hypothetical protein